MLKMKLKLLKLSNKLKLKLKLKFGKIRFLVHGLMRQNPIRFLYRRRNAELTGLSISFNNYLSNETSVDPPAYPALLAI